METSIISSDYNVVNNIINFVKNHHDRETLNMDLFDIYIEVFKNYSDTTKINYILEKTMSKMQRVYPDQHYSFIKYLQDVYISCLAVNMTKQHYCSLCMYKLNINNCTTFDLTKNENICDECLQIDFVSF